MAIRSIEHLTEEVIKNAFNGTNFGRTDFATILAETVLKRAAGYHSGSTATAIATHLGLLSAKNQSATKLGLTFAHHLYYKQTVRDAIATPTSQDTELLPILIEAYEEARAATAPSAKLPAAFNVKMGGDKVTRAMFQGMNMMRQDCIKALREQGYQVEGK